jgi:DNA-binding transcriptional ArsR family regulator
VRTTLDVLLHPVRYRLVRALAHRPLATTGQLLEELRDVAPATVYRQLGVLAKAGMISVVDERAARGTPERIYALAKGASVVRPEESAAATPEQHLRFFSMFVGGLIGDFRRYLQRGGSVDLGRAGVTYRQVQLDLSDREFRELLRQLESLVESFAERGPRRGRRRRVLTVIAIPEAGGDENV